MRIGLDIDGVVINFLDGFRDVAQQDFPDPLVWDMQTEWGYADRKDEYLNIIREAQQATNDYPADYWMLSHSDMAELEAHELYIITARSPEVMTGILTRFAQEKLNIQGAIFNASSGKSTWAEKLLLTAMIEDRAETAIEFTGTVPCWLLNKSWNQKPNWGLRVDTVAQLPAAVISWLGAVKAPGPPFIPVTPPTTTTRVAAPAAPAA